MPVLTSKWEDFCQLVALGYTPRHAYAAVWSNADKKIDPTKEAARTAASRLMHRPIIFSRIKTLKHMRAEGRVPVAVEVVEPDGVHDNTYNNDTDVRPTAPRPARPAQQDQQDAARSRRNTLAGRLVAEEIPLPFLHKVETALETQNRLIQSNPDKPTLSGLSKRSLSAKTQLRDAADTISAAISIAERSIRIQELDKRWKGMQALIEARAAAFADKFAGGDTGLLDADGKPDIMLLKELRNYAKQAAQELGQWVERTDSRVMTANLSDLSDEAIDQLIAREKMAASANSVEPGRRHRGRPFVEHVGDEVQVGDVVIEAKAMVESGIAPLNDDDEEAVRRRRTRAKQAAMRVGGEPVEHHEDVHSNQ